MRLAWFYPSTHVSDQLDDTAALIAALRHDHSIERFDQSRAHEFVRLDFRDPFDLTVFELANTDEHAFVWPYLLHYPGALRLRSLSLHESRTRSLHRQHRIDDRSAELAFSHWDFIGAPVLGSKLTVVSDTHIASRLQSEFPMARVRQAPIGLGSSESSRVSPPGVPGQARPPAIPRVGVFDSSRQAVVRRAIERSRTAGVQLEMMTETSPESVLTDADIIVALQWPPADELTTVIASMAAGRTVITFESENAAGWPALDPQTWQPRGWTPDKPAVISIDPRDEEHSLSLALRRLAGDHTLRSDLATAGHNWWREHATVDHAVRAWREILSEAVSLAPPSRPAGWPAHLTADGTERARQILAEFGQRVDFLE